MKIQMNKVKCVADRSYNKADDMHLMASIKSRLVFLSSPAILKGVLSLKTQNFVVK